MYWEIIGTICKIYKVKVINPSFYTREFVLDISEEYSGVMYTGYAVMQLRNSACDFMEDKKNVETIRFVEGDRVKVSFKLKGTLGRDKDTVFNTIQAVRVVAAPQDFGVYTPAAAQPITDTQRDNFQAQQGNSGNAYNSNNGLNPETIDDLPF